MLTAAYSSFLDSTSVGSSLCSWVCYQLTYQGAVEADAPPFLTKRARLKDAQRVVTVDTQCLWQWQTALCILSLAVLKGIVSVNSPHKCSRPQFRMGVAENLCYWLGVTKSYLSNGLLVVPLPNWFE